MRLLCASRNPWFVGFNRYEGTVSEHVDFYINGRKVSTRSGVPQWETPGNSADMRLVLGSRENSVKFTGGPMRNVFWWTDQGDSLDDALVHQLYQQGAGFLPKLV